MAWVLLFPKCRGKLRCSTRTYKYGAVELVFELSLDPVNSVLTLFSSRPCFVPSVETQGGSRALTTVVPLSVKYVMYIC